MVRTIKIYSLFLFLLSCANSQEEKSFWKYSKPEEEKQVKPIPKITFSDIEKTLDIKLTEDSTITGCWISNSNHSGYSFSSLNNELQFHLWDYNYRDEEMINLFKSGCHYQLEKIKSKTRTRSFCRGGNESSYYAISKIDSSLLEFRADNDSLESVYKKIKHPLEPIWEKQAKYELYKSRDTLTVGWFQDEDGYYIDTRLIRGRDQQLYLMIFSGNSYEVIRCITSPHEKGTKVYFEPWNLLSKIFWPRLKPYGVLSHDSSKLYKYVTIDGEEEVTVMKRIERTKYDNWIDEHLFGQEGNGEPWR